MHSGGVIGCLDDTLCGNSVAASFCTTLKIELCSGTGLAGRLGRLEDPEDKKEAEDLFEEDFCSTTDDERLDLVACEMLGRRPSAYIRLNSTWDNMYERRSENKETIFRYLEPDAETTRTKEIDQPQQEIQKILAYFV